MILKSKYNLKEMLFIPYFIHYEITKLLYRCIKTVGREIINLGLKGRELLLDLNH